MIKTKHLLAIFLPAFLLVGIVLFIRIIQYQPLFPSKEEYKKLASQSEFQIPIYAEDPIIGDKKAPLTLIVFADFGCAGCKAQMDILQQVMAKHPGKIKIIWKGLPATKFPFATDLAHEYGYCLNQQNQFAEFKDLAFANSDNLSQATLSAIVKQIKIKVEKFNDCLATETAKPYLQKIEQLALALNIQAVPTIFIDNKQIEPPQLLESWEALLNL